MASEDGRDEAGKFAKGNKIVPKVRKSSRRKDNIELLNAIATNAYTPLQLTIMLKETYAMAESQDDWKGMYAVIAFVMAYGVGKPVQRSITANLDADDVRAMFFEDEVESGNDDDEGSVVDVHGGDE